MYRLAAAVFVLSLYGLSDSATAAPGDPARAVAAGAGSILASSYVYPSRARSAAQLLRRNADAGAYDGLAGQSLGDKLTSDLATVLHDKHVRVRYSAGVLPPQPAPEATPDAAERHTMREIGYGLGRVAHLPGNVGYLDVRLFPSADNELDTVFDGMVDAVAYSEVIVLDLRRNHGGSPDAIARLLSHFLPAKTHLNDFIGRGDGNPPVAESTYTQDVPGPRITAPVYVLTSHETFSGGEECAYDLQALKRGTLVGETTGGGANPGDQQRIDDHFAIFVPTERARNPITLTNWEGIGVKPDIAVVRDRALATAFGLALDLRLHDAAARAAEPERFARLDTLRAKLGTMTDAEILDL